MSAWLTPHIHRGEPTVFPIRMFSFWNRRRSDPAQRAQEDRVRQALREESPPAAIDLELLETMVDVDLNPLESPNPERSRPCSRPASR